MDEIVLNDERQENNLKKKISPERIIIVCSAVLLAAASIISVNLPKDLPRNVFEISDVIKGPQSDEVTGITNDSEFAAVATASYNNGLVDIKVETNAPTGSVLRLHLNYPGLEEVTEYVKVYNGIARKQIGFPEDLPADYLTVSAQLDMSDENALHGGKTFDVFGQKGEKMLGEMVAEAENGYKKGVSENFIISYPNEQAVAEQLRMEFYSYITKLENDFSPVFERIKSGENLDWTSMHVIFTDEMTLEENWATFTDDLKQKYFDLFRTIIYQCKMVDEDEQITIYFEDTAGNVLDIG